MFNFFKKSKSRNKDSYKDNKKVKTQSSTDEQQNLDAEKACAVPLELTSQDGGVGCINQKDCSQNKTDTDRKSKSASNDVSACERTSIDVNLLSNCSNNKSGYSFFDIMAKGRNKRYNNKKTNKNTAKTLPTNESFDNNNQQNDGKPNEKCENIEIIAAENFPNDVNQTEEKIQIGLSHKNVSEDENKPQIQCENQNVIVSTNDETSPNLNTPSDIESNYKADALQHEINDVNGKVEGEINGKSTASDNENSTVESKDENICIMGGDGAAKIESFANNTLAECSNNDGGISAADFVKELVFQKYKNSQQQTPIHTQTVQLNPQQAIVVENLNYFDSNLDEMGQPPSKSSNANHQHRTAIRVPVPEVPAQQQPPTVAQQIPNQLSPSPPLVTASSVTHSKKSVTFATPLEDSIIIPSLYDHESSPDDYYYEADDGPDDTDDNSDIEELASDDDSSEPTEIPPLDKSGNFEMDDELLSNDDDDEAVAAPDISEDDDEEDEITDNENQKNSTSKICETQPNDSFHQNHIISNFPINEENSLLSNNIKTNFNENNNKRLCLHNDVKNNGEIEENHNDDEMKIVIFNTNNKNSHVNSFNKSTNYDCVSDANEQQNSSQNCDNAFILNNSEYHGDDMNNSILKKNDRNFSENNNNFNDSNKTYTDGAHNFPQPPPHSSTTSVLRTLDAHGGKSSHFSENYDKINIDGDDVMKTRHNQQDLMVTRKTAYSEDSVSLPDVVESNSIVVVNGADTSKMISVSEEKMYETDKLNHEMRELVNQESRYSAKIEAAETKALEAQNKADELYSKIVVLDKDLADKSWNVERLQAEWESAIKEGECMRRQVAKQKADMENIKQLGYETEEDLKEKLEEMTAQNLTTQAKLEEMQTQINTLQEQIAEMNKETEQMRNEKNYLEEQRQEEQKIIQDALETAVMEREQLEAKWKNEFEELRNHHTDREEHLMEDCEWQLRSMQKQCKDKLETSEKERKVALGQVKELEVESIICKNEIVKYKSFEVEVDKLRGLSRDQKDSLRMMTRQIEELRIELEAANIRLEIELENVKTIKRKCANDISEKERQTLHAIETQRNEISSLWERRLFEEMDRLKTELEQIHAEERHSALEKLKDEMMEDAAEMTNRYNMREKQLWEEIEALKEKLNTKCHELVEAQTSRDRQIVESRMFVERAQRNHQQELDAEIRDREAAIEELKETHERYKEEMEEDFTKRILQVQEEFSQELTDSTDALIKKHKKELDIQWKNLLAEKDQALQSLEQKYRTKLDAAENKLNELAATHKRTLKDLEDAHKTERSCLETRDLQNSREIDTLHRKCRCLTKLFEEMRMRYERRDPRPEDLNQIDELKSIVEAQDRDLQILTERLREIQMNQEPGSTPSHQQPQGGAPPRKLKSRAKPPQLDLQNVNQQSPLQPRYVAQSPTKSPGLKPNIEIIYEENENDVETNGKEVQSNHEVIASEF